jgi:hypothetical protein
MSMRGAPAAWFLVCAAATAHAGTIDTRPANPLSAQPSNDVVYFGQTFLADDVFLSWFSFTLSEFAGDATVVGEVYATDLAGLPTGAALFGAAFDVPDTFPASGDVSFFPHLALVPGTLYAIVLRPLPSPGVTVIYASDGGDAYPGGGAVVTSDGGSSWSDIGGLDLSVQVVMNPEPGTFALFALGAAGLASAVRRRRASRR